MEIPRPTPRPSAAPTSATPRRRSAPAAVRALSLTVLVLAGLLGPAATASAHADLVASTPGDQEQLQQAPSEVALTFSQPVGEQFASVTVTGPDGQTWQDGDALVSGERVVQPLRALSATGDYRADWRVVASDGHVLEGTVPFVYAPPQEQQPADAPTEEPVPGDSEEASAPVAVDAQPAASTESADGPSPTLLVAVLAGAAVIVLGGAALVRRRSRTPQPRG